MGNKFYKSPKWLRTRDRVLRHDEYLCRHCKRYGKTTAAETVHHVYPLDEYPELALNPHNLISLCNPCHNKMHDRNTRAITEIGREWQARIGKLHGHCGIPMSL